MELVLEHILTLIINWTMRVTEYIGVIVLAVSVIRGMIGYIRKDPEAVTHMGEGMTSAMSFLLAGEILRTVTIGTITDIVIVAGIIALRTAIVLLIHWENKHRGNAGEHPAKPKKHELIKHEKHAPEKHGPEGPVSEGPAPEERELEESRA